MTDIHEFNSTADIDFLLACQEGDLDAFALLYKRHAPAVLRYAWARLRHQGLAEEVLQETFVTAWAKRKKSSIVDLSLLPWLLAICRNHIRNQIRRNERTRAVPLEFAAEEAAPARDDLGWIEEALTQLSGLDRRICELCLIDGLSYREAAELVESTPAAVGKRLQRARARLRAALAEDRS